MGLDRRSSEDMEVLGARKKKMNVRRESRPGSTTEKHPRRWRVLLGDFAQFDHPAGIGNRRHRSARRLLSLPVSVFHILTGTLSCSITAPFPYTYARPAPERIRWPLKTNFRTVDATVCRYGYLYFFFSFLFLICPASFRVFYY